LYKSVVIRTSSTTIERRSASATPSFAARSGRRNRQSIAAKEHEYLRIGATINPQCSAERMGFAIKERLHRTIHEHLLQLLNAADGAEFWQIHVLLIADATY
jgi:hypothetical protein